MGVSTPATSTALRGFARRQGIILGGIFGIVAVIVYACLKTVPIGNNTYLLGSLLPSTNDFIYLLAFLTFFLAGWRVGRRTGRADIGGLAGFWAGVVAAVVVTLIDVVLTLSLLAGDIPRMSRSELVPLAAGVLVLIGRDVILALLLGAGFGVLGGFIGRTSAGVPAAPAAPVQPVQMPPAPQQNQP